MRFLILPILLLTSCSHLSVKELEFSLISPPSGVRAARAGESKALLIKDTGEYEEGESLIKQAKDAFEELTNFEDEGEEIPQK